MIQAVRSLDRLKAAGIIARAALSVGYAEIPFGNTLIDHENDLLAKIIAEARTRLALTPDDNSSETFEKIADFLDQNPTSCYRLLTQALLCFVWLNEATCRPIFMRSI